jgi:hypothetical protein
LRRRRAHRHPAPEKRSEERERVREHRRHQQADHPFERATSTSTTVQEAGFMLVDAALAT